VRGLGIMRVVAQARCAIRLVVDLMPRENIPRFPLIEPESQRTVVLSGVSVPRLCLCAWDQTAALKVALALQERTGLAAMPTKAHFPD
jgi:HPr kinase/phosphorylase